MTGHEAVGDPIDEYNTLRLARAVSLFDETIAEYDASRLAEEGVYAEIHGHDNHDAILALAPDLPLSISPTEYGHSVFDNMLGVQVFRSGPPMGSPELIRKVLELDLRGTTVMVKGYVYERETSRILALLEHGGKLPSKTIVDRMREKFGIDIVTVAGEIYKTSGVPEGMDFSTPPRVLSEIAFAPMATVNEGNVETGISDYLHTRTDVMSGFNAAYSGVQEVVSVDIEFLHARLPTHQKVADLALAQYRPQDDHRARNIERGSWVLHTADGELLDAYTKVRYQLDERVRSLNVDVLVEPQEEPSVVRANIEKLESFCGVLLVATLQGFADQRSLTRIDTVFTSFIITAAEADDGTRQKVLFYKFFPLQKGEKYPDGATIMPQTAAIDWRSS